MHFVYIVECRDASLYTGSTSDLDRRVREHNGAKTGAKYTKARRPVALRYSESLPTLSAALKREAEIKKLSRKEKRALIGS